MKVFRLPLTTFCATVLAFGILTVNALAGDDTWRPVTAQEAALKESAIEKGADAEAIFWEVRVDDGSSEELAMNHYIRVKIFTERGREKYSKIDIPYLKGKKVRNVQARVIKADGSIVELKKEEVFDRDIVKADGVKIKAKSFAVPGIEPGAIIEYRYREVIAFGMANNMPLVFQRDIPMQNVAYYVRPAAASGVLKYLTFNLNNTRFEKDKNGFYRAMMTNVPALQVEPYMPPEDEVRSWMFIYYTSKATADPATYWANAGGAIVEIFDIKDTLKPNGELKKAAAEIIGGSQSDDEKLAKLYEFCRTQIKNTTYDPSLTDEAREQIKPNKSTNDTYKRKQGTLGDINELFASLAVAAGFEARITFTGDRTQIIFSPKYAHARFIDPAGIAIKVSNRWRYFAPGNQFAVDGHLPWQYEQGTAFLLGAKDYVTTETPLADCETSTEKRTAKFKLLEDGTLEGTVRIEYSGHLGYQRKLNNYEDSANKREETLKAEIKSRINAAEINDITVENVSDPAKPFAYVFKARIPNYAQKTGKRLFLQPNFFEYGSSPLFTASTRKHPIHFNYPWSENDSIEIELPDGYALESPDAPAPIADAQKISSDSIRMTISMDKRKLTYDRKFYFGGGGNIMFPVNAYPALKNMFEAFHKNDTHSLVLKQGSAAAAGSGKTN